MSNQYHDRQPVPIDMTAKPSPNSAPWAWPILLAAIVFMAQALWSAPGELIADSREQLGQALSGEFSDWHPPVMALVWSWLIKLGATTGSLLVLHQFLHWLGIALLSDACLRSDRRREAWLILAAGVFPVFVYYDRIVVKDVGMASAFVAAVGIIGWFILQQKRVPVWATLLSGLALTYGLLIRTNAVFALGPILLLYLPVARRTTLPKILAWSVVAALLAVPLSNWINHKAIGASPQYPVQSLQLFDLMGVAVHSEDNHVMGPKPPELESIRACYTPYWWDPVSPWGSCPALRLKLGYTRSLDTTDPAVVATTAAQWHQAIFRHPLAYLAHRLEFFNSSLYFIVPSFSFRYSKAADLAPYGKREVEQREIQLDYLKNNFLWWPVVWVYLGLCALVSIEMLRDASVTTRVGRLLIISGLLFAGAYLIVGVATESRYYYWSVMAILLGIILTSRNLAAFLRAHRRLSRVMAAGLLLVVALGLTARIVDVPLL
jgi:4-amino-4-deoxy-L-arabinose transferase-like glycosyltransferase